MALLKIARMGHPVLLARAQNVEDPSSPEIQRLIADMIETMDDAGGVGLAAPQVHIPLRLFVMRLPAERNKGESTGPIVMINPSFTPADDEIILRREGCLSIPGLTALVPRHVTINYEALDADETPIEGTAGGFYANVFQHEYDHLDGILYPMRITDFSSFGFAEEQARHARKVQL